MEKTYSEKLKDPRWQQKRLKILERDKWTCQQCYDQSTTLNVHHIKYKGEPWEAQDDWLVTLCEDCHKKESEAAKIEAELLINAFREKGFTSFELMVFRKKIIEELPGRSWTAYEPNFSILQHAIRSWEIISDMFFGVESKKKRFIKPTIEELTKVFKEKGQVLPSIMAEKFYAHYESNGWMVGKNKMKSWKGAVSTWVLNNKQYGKINQPTTIRLGENNHDGKEYKL